MGHLGNTWARAHPRATAVFGAVFLIGFIAFFRIFWSPDLVSTTQEVGTLVEIKGSPAQDHEGRLNLVLGTVRLDDGTEVRVFLHRPIPEVGDRVPLRAELYDDQSVVYVHDTEAWIDSAIR